ncbi:MAG: FAD-dependent oxidoreductase [Bacteroidetes bacterium]|nr:MAG: FAD-dependent oxidoreductase [Bacteroidota bacterium]
MANQNSVFDKKICIVGAGVSGLGSAKYLKDKGYRNITVLEKTEYVGGKAHSVFVDNKPYDMGALEINWSDVYVRRLMAEFGLTPLHIPLISVLDGTTGDISPMTSLAPSLLDKFKTVIDCFKYIYQLTRHSAFANGPTFENLPLELAQPFSEWLKTYKMESLEWVFNGVLFTFGYGEQKDIAAAYVLKFMHMNNFLTMTQMFLMEILGKPPIWPCTIEGGFQSLFVKVAESLPDVRTNVNITKISRNMSEDQPITVEYTNSKTGEKHSEKFDRIIITVLQATQFLSPFLDLTPQEKSLFDQVQYNHYWSIVAKHNGFPAQDYLILKERGELGLPPTGNPVALVRNFEDRDVWVVNSYSEANTGDEEMKKNTADNFDMMGRKGVQFPQAENGDTSFYKWNYFPRVNGESMKEGFYEKLEALQGVNATYYAGGLLNYEVTESTLHNANDLIDRKFTEASWNTHKNLKQDICIIGSGAAGLSAALYLQDKGYSSVTILEKNDFVGGKCHSYIDKNGQAYDMGALEITQAYTEVIKIMARFGVESYPVQDLNVIDGQTGKVTPLTSLDPSILDKFKTAIDTLKYFYYLSEHKSFIQQPNMLKMPEDLTMPFEDWLIKYGMKDLINNFIPAIFCYGYGDLKDIPAAYALKYMNSRNFGALVSVLVREAVGYDPKWPQSITGGFQVLWEKVAASLPNIHTGVSIEKIIRNEGQEKPITVIYSTKNGEKIEHKFDKLIYTPVVKTDLLSPIMELTAQEKTLFDKVKYNYYFTTAVDASNFPAEELFVLKQNGKICLPNDGEPVSFIRHFENTNTLVVYSYSKAPTTIAEIQRKLIKSLKQMKGTNINIIKTWSWEYFPHVEGADLKAGFYEQMEKLQGANDTFYLGGLMNFEDVENTVEYSKYLVGQWF